VSGGRLKPPGTVSRSVRGAGARLQRHPLRAGLAVALVGAVLGWLAWESTNGVPLQPRYSLHAMVPSSAPIVKPGDAVRIAGRLAGIVTDVEPHDGARDVTMSLSPGYAPVGRNARVRVTVKSIVYLTYVAIDPGDLGRPMPSGGTVPLRRSTSGVGILQVVQLFDKQAQRTLQEATANAGLGLAGRGPDLNAALRDLPPTLRDATPELRALTATPGALATSLDAADRVVRGLAGARADDPRALLRSGAGVTGAVAARDAALGRSLDELPAFERAALRAAPLADPVLRDATSLSRTIRPALDSLAAALPALDRGLALGGVLRRQTARLTGALIPVIRAATPVIASLEPTIASMHPLLSSLGSLVHTISPYRRDFVRAGRGIVAATTERFDAGQTASGSPALRFAPILTCARARNPYPRPNSTRRHSQPC
jgi:phospholipid/cholesterol/gamma-HCH transport system substrate-binding protein